MVKVSVKPKTAFKSKKTFILGISLGSESVEGHRLEAIIETVNEGGFRKGVIDLSDSLKRYKYMQDGLSEQEATKKAEEEGAKWLERNISTLDKLSAESVDIRRWSEWLEHPDYAKQRRYFENLYNTNEMFRSAVNHDIKRYHTRTSGSMNRINITAYTLSKNFFLEELAAHSIMFSEYDATNIYPGKQLESYKLIRSGQIQGTPQMLSNSPYAKLVFHSFNESKQIFRTKAA